MAGRDWKKLAAYVVRDRIARGYRSRGEFAEATGITERTLGNLERGQSVSAATLAVVETALRWVPGSAATVLDEDGEPTVQGRKSPLQEVDEARARVLDASPAELIKMRSFIEQVRGREEADAFLSGALELQEEARRNRAASNDPHTGRSAS